jgi:hypothetical protein
MNGALGIGVMFDGRRRRHRAAKEEKQEQPGSHPDPGKAMDLGNGWAAREDSTPGLNHLPAPFPAVHNN